MRPNMLTYSGANHQPNTNAASFPISLKTAATTIGVLGVIGWLGWLALRLKAENSELEAQLFEIRSDQTYEVLNQESLKMWENAPVEIKNEIPSDLNPILLLNPRDPSGIVSQISRLSHQMYGCYDTKSRLSTELRDWKSRENQSRSLADGRYDEMTKAKNEIIACKDGWMDELKTYQKAKEGALKECQNEFKLSQQMFDDKRDYSYRLCEQNKNVAVGIVEDKMNKALQDCETQKSKQREFFEEERKNSQFECNARIQSSHQKLIDEITKHATNKINDPNANKLIERLEAELAESRTKLDECKHELKEQKSELAEQKKELSECKNSRNSKWFWQ